MTIKIENWSVESGADSPYVPPEHAGIRLVGQCFGHGEHDDGKRIGTSTVVASEGRFVTTFSGSRYELGKPDPKWLAWMEEEGIEYDPEQPIKLIQV